MPVSRVQSVATAPHGTTPSRPDLRLFAPEENARDENASSQPAITGGGDPIPLAESHSVRWLHLTDEARRELFRGQDPALGLPLQDWVEGGRLSVVKHGPHRTVYRLRPLPNGQMDPTGAPVWYLKRFRGAGWGHTLRDKLLGSRAEREYHAARRIAELDIATIYPVLLGVSNGRDRATAGDSWLATRGIEEGVPLDEFVGNPACTGSKSEQVAFRQELARTLGQIAARLHSAGICHPDLHAGNILVARKPMTVSPASATDPGWKFWLIDLHAVRMTSGHADLPESLRRRNVAELHRFFTGQSTRADRARFWRAYLAERGEPTFDRHVERNRRLAWERSLSVSAETGLARADRAWRRGNRHVRRKTTGRGEFRAVATMSRTAWEAWVAGPDQILSTAAVTWCKQGATRQVAAVAFPEPDSVAYLKRMDRSPWLKRLSDGWLQPVARRAWEIGHQLLRRGIDTPRPLAFAALRQHGRSVQYLLTEAVPDSLTLLDWCAELRSRQWESTQRRQALASRLHGLARILARLHACGFDHRDLKFQNLLVSRQPDSGQVWLLDLDGVRQHSLLRWLPGGWFQKRRVQNLSRLAVSAFAQGILTRSDALRFLRAYLSTQEWREWKGWWRAIQGRVHSKRRRNQRRGRPLA